MSSGDRDDAPWWHGHYVMEAEAAHWAMCRRHGGAWWAMYESERAAALAAGGGG